MRKLTLIALLLLTTVVTTGCIKSVIRFNPDGSGQLEIGLNLSLQSLEEAGETSGSSNSGDVDDLSPLIESGEVITDERTGITFGAEERLENGSMWTYFIFTVPTVEAWGKLNIVAQENLPADDSEDPLPSANTLAAIPRITVTDSTIRLEMTVPSDVDPDADVSDDPFAEITNAFIQVSYEIEMPGELIDHNGQIDSLTGNPVWLIDPTSPDDVEIFVESARE